MTSKVDYLIYIQMLITFILVNCFQSIAKRWKTKRKEAERKRERGELIAWRKTSEGARVVQLAAHVVAAIDKEAFRRAKFTPLKDVSIAVGDNWQSPGLDLDKWALERPTSSSEVWIKGALAAERGKIVKELIHEVMELGLDTTRSPGAVMGFQSISKLPDEPLEYARLWVDCNTGEVPQPANGRRRTWKEWINRHKNPGAKKQFEHHYEVFRNWAWDRDDESSCCALLSGFRDL